MTRIAAHRDPPSLRIEGKIAIVTGAGQGIGRGIALVFARAGAKVVVAEIKAHRMEETVAEIRALGLPVAGVVADVGKRADVFAMVDETVRTFGAIDVLVNNAQSYAPRTPIAEITEEQVDVFVDSGIKGT